MQPPPHLGQLFPYNKQDEASEPINRTEWESAIEAGEVETEREPEVESKVEPNIEPRTEPKVELPEESEGELEPDGKRKKNQN